MSRDNSGEQTDLLTSISFCSVCASVSIARELTVNR